MPTSGCAQAFVEEVVIEAALLQQSVRWSEKLTLVRGLDVLASDLCVLAVGHTGTWRRYRIQFRQRPRNEVRLCEMLWEAQTEQ